MFLALLRRAIATAALALCFAPTLLGCASSSPAEAPTRRMLTVVGLGEVRARPDVARVTIGVEHAAATAVEASRQNAASMNQLIDTLKKAGIAEKDLQTSGLSVHFERAYPGGPMPPPMPMPIEAPQEDRGAPGAPGGARPQPGGAAPGYPGLGARITEPVGWYRVSNSVQVTVRDLDRLGSLLDQAIASGANQLHGVHFTLDEPRRLDAEVHREAVADARRRAAALAEMSGVELGEVLSVSEVIGRSLPGMMAPMAEARGYAMQTPVMPGEVTSSGQVEMIFAIRPKR